MVTYQTENVAIHNKNGKGLLPANLSITFSLSSKSQSTIKMEKGYYKFVGVLPYYHIITSQSTIKMEKGYYVAIN